MCARPTNGALGGAGAAGALRYFGLHQQQRRERAVEAARKPDRLRGLLEGATDRGLAGGDDLVREILLFADMVAMVFVAFLAAASAKMVSHSVASCRAKRRASPRPRGPRDDLTLIGALASRKSSPRRAAGTRIWKRQPSPSRVRWGTLPPLTLRDERLRPRAVGATAGTSGGTSTGTDTCDRLG
jgi:hypothetical protein